MRLSIRLFCVLSLIGLLLPAGQIQAAKVEFTFATTNGPKDISSRAVVRWQKAMREASNGELDMTFIPGGALGGDKQLLQQLTSNEIQLHVAGPVVVHHLVREYQCLEAEFVYNNEAHGFRVWTGPLGKEVSKKLEKGYNITIIGVGSRGARNVTSNVPISKPEDLKGVKIRVTNKLRQQVFTAYGALPTPLSITEVYGALQQGVVDAQENPISTIWGNKFYEVQKYINLTGHVWSYWIISANSGFINSLSAKHRKIFMGTLGEAIAWLNKTVASETGKLLKKMEKTGVKVIKPDVAAFQKIAAPVVKKFAAEKCRPGLLKDIAKYAGS